MITVDTKNIYNFKTHWTQISHVTNIRITTATKTKLLTESNGYNVPKNDKIYF